MAQLANYAAQTAAAYGSADASHAAAGFSRAQTATENVLRRARGGYANEQYRNLKLNNDNFAPSFNNWTFNHDSIFGRQVVTVKWVLVLLDACLTALLLILLLNLLTLKALNVLNLLAALDVS